MTRGQFDNAAIDFFAGWLRPLANEAFPFYRRFPYRGKLWISEIDLRIAVCPEFRFVYNRLPKVANSTVTAALAEAVHTRLGEAGAAPRNHFQRPSRSRRTLVQEMDDWLWFAFVRNPFSRVLSAYLDKVVGQRRQARRMRRRLGLTPDFEGFCRYLDQGGLMDDNHWAPQVEGLVRPPGDYDFLGRFETLEPDFASLHQQLFDAPAPPIGVRGPEPTKASHRLAEHYTETATGIVRRLYAVDFETFSYSPALPG